MFDTIKYLLAAEGKKLNFFAAWALAQVELLCFVTFLKVTLAFVFPFCAGMLTVSSGILSYPWDTVRRRMMMQSGRSDILYKNTLDCAMKIIRNEGMRPMGFKCCVLLVEIRRVALLEYFPRWPLAELLCLPSMMRFRNSFEWTSAN
ncbi:hypothetical protein COOONC_23402 [Cooperia oncophora]